MTKYISAKFNKVFFLGVCNTTHTLFNWRIQKIKLIQNQRLYFGSIKLNNKYTSWDVDRIISGRSGLQYRDSSQRIWKYHLIWEGPFNLQYEKLTLETGDPPVKTSANAQHAAWWISTGEGPKKLNKSYSRRDTNNDARNPHYGTSSSIQFQDGPETYSNF